MIRLSAPLTCLLILLISSPVLAATYSFTNIIDSTVAAPTGNYLNIGDAAISGNRVAFKAGYFQGSLGIIDSIFTSAGGPRTEVVQELRNAPSGGTFSEIRRPSIVGGKVYFGARVFFSQTFSYGNGIFSGEGVQSPSGPVVATNGSPDSSVYKIFADPLGSDGLLAFRASTSSPTTPDAIYKTGAGTPRIVGKGDLAPPGGTFSSIDVNYGFSNGTAAFRGLYGEQEGIFTGAGGPLTTIAKQGDATPLGSTFETLVDPTISGANVAFLGSFTDGSGIFTGDGGSLLTIVRTGDTTPSGDTFSSFSVPAIGGGTVAFRGNFAGGDGIYTKTGAVLRTVIETGNSLFGSTVASLNFSDLGLDPGGSGNLAFTYGLADGRSGVVMAVPGAGLPTIFKDASGTVPVPDSVGITFVPVADFEGRDLTNAYLAGADLKNAKAQSVNLTNAYMRNTDLSNADLRNANLSSANLEAARLTAANFSGANVKGTNFTRIFITTPPTCNSGGCFGSTTTSYGGIAPTQLYATASYLAHDLAGINLVGNAFNGANFVGQNLTNATLSNNAIGDRPTALSNANFRQANLTNANFYAANLTGANLSQSLLKNSNLSGADLTGANLTGADVRGAHLGGTTVNVYGYYCVNPAAGGCFPVFGVVSTYMSAGINLEQLKTTASYQTRDLTGIDLANTNLAAANFAGFNLTNTNFKGTTLVNGNLSGADSRGSLFTDAVITNANQTNFIRADGHVDGLDLAAGQELHVRDYDGDPTHGIMPLPIAIDQHFSISPGGMLRMVLDADAWDSTISFAAGIPVTLGGTLELVFTEGTNLASQTGRTFQLFDWTGVAPTGKFAVSSPYRWDLTNLYTTGEVTLAGVPEPSAIFLTAAGFLALTFVRRKKTP